MKASLKIDISFTADEVSYSCKAGDLITVDLNEGSASHPNCPFDFEIDTTEYSINQ